MGERTSRSRNSKDAFSPLSPSDRKTIISASCLSLKSVLLHDWWLVKAEDKGIAVAGFASRERIDATTLETSDGITIQISGFINRSQTHQNGFPFMVCNSFLLGFPYRWKECVSQCCGEESSKSSGTDASTFLPLTLDNLPATTLRDHVMCFPEDSENFICDILGKLRDNAFQYASVAGNSNLANECPNSEIEETLRNHKKVKTDQMHIDDDDRILEARDVVTKVNQSKGVVTRSMSRSRNLRSNIEGETSAQLSTSAAKKNESAGVVCALHASSTQVLP
ncbi:protein EMBRYO DEFECTIVE 1674 isoform X2 [Hevea brasiliensis]|uniref:protein EMBRYO DEFECTIVE 1674 isoform X2 n=1 Tax=Hevea brasiliensis TaxID=3981 RepID=UPI0025EFC75C|nr:protein EMBRYO DEFECTIVE 1674 isoform X2 [Hevea brasiliensis]